VAVEWLDSRVVGPIDLQAATTKKQSVADNTELQNPPICLINDVHESGFLDFNGI